MADVEPHNESLIEAMRLLARNRDDWHRKQVYQEVLRANLVVPVKRPVTDAEDLTLEDLVAADELVGRPSFVAFTDLSGLKKWRRDHEYYQVIQGVPFVLLLASGKVGSLLINRGGKVGGELYYNEIDTMARAVTGARPSRA